LAAAILFLSRRRFFLSSSSGATYKIQETARFMGGKKMQPTLNTLPFFAAKWQTRTAPR